MTSAYNSARVSVSVFVTSYAIGNEQGFAVGKWFNLADYKDRDSFEADAVRYLKSLGDSDPEIAYPDYDIEGPYELAKHLISEDYISADLWELMNMDQAEAEILSAYIWAFSPGHDDTFQELLTKALDSFAGQFDNRDDFIEDYLDKYYGELLEDLPNLIAGNLDKNGIYEDIRHDYFEAPGGYYFHAQ